MGLTLRLHEAYSMMNLVCDKPAQTVACIGPSEGNERNPDDQHGELDEDFCAERSGTAQVNESAPRCSRKCSNGGKGSEHRRFSAQP